LGDCGSKVNYINKEGYYALGDLTKVSGLDEGSSGLANIIPGGIAK
jgi:hypothetical protein